jgi:SWI/SNF-related matrix-associated actin-dependent regulator 1 of chromatin subfamily A
MSDDESANHAGEKDTMLSHLLKQLRPFQREAYDFCCEGIVPTRKCSNVISHDGSNIDRHDESKSSKKIVYQNDLLGKGRILLADEMGLGKSITSLAIMAHYRTNDWPLLILCPASLRYTW